MLLLFQGNRGRLKKRRSHSVFLLPAVSEPLRNASEQNLVHFSSFAEANPSFSRSQNRCAEQQLLLACQLTRRKIERKKRGLERAREKRRAHVCEKLFLLRFRTVPSHFQPRPLSLSPLSLPLSGPPAPAPTPAPRRHRPPLLPFLLRLPPPPRPGQRRNPQRRPQEGRQRARDGRARRQHHPVRGRRALLHV